MTDDEKYLFDLTGYLVVEGALSPDEVRVANEAIDRHAKQIEKRSRDMALSGDSKALFGAEGRGELGGMLGWEKPWCEPFRQMLVHPRIVPYLHVILGEGFRLDHGPGVLTMGKGAEGHLLHGASGPSFDPTEYYLFRNGRMHNGLTVVSWQLTDVNEGDGGFCVVPGSHKGNFPCPASLRRGEEHQQFVKAITCKAGDAVIFTEALTHGTLPWKADHLRRSVLFKLSPAPLSYSSGYSDCASDPKLADMTEAQRAVMERPYRAAAHRPSVGIE